MPPKSVPVASQEATTDLCSTPAPELHVNGITQVCIEATPLLSTWSVRLAPYPRTAALSVYCLVQWPCVDTHLDGPLRDSQLL
jgi:hypothetical protein